MTKLYANYIGYSDMYPYEVVRIVSDKCMEVRWMETHLINAQDLQFDVGGFAAHCANQSEQKWSYASDTNAPIFKIRKNKRGTWKDKHGDTYAIMSEPRRRYDFNF